MVLVTFSLAQEDSKKMERMYTGIKTKTASTMLTEQVQVTPPSSAITQQ